jgi:hypothetical protein
MAQRTAGAADCATNKRIPADGLAFVYSLSAVYSAFVDGLYSVPDEQTLIYKRSFSGRNVVLLSLSSSRSAFDSFSRLSELRGGFFHLFAWK